MPPRVRSRGRYGIGVGSGLILLLIVGMWLAVLVPMWLKSYDSGANLSSVDRFSDAMRVLSRRHVAMGDRRTMLMPPRPRAVLSAGPGASVPVATERAARIQAALARTVPTIVAVTTRATPPSPVDLPPVDLRSVGARSAGSLPNPERVRTPPAGRTAADRRLRTLGGLLGAAGLTLVLALIGPGLLLLVHLLVDALLLAFVVHCRRLAVLRADQARADDRHVTLRQVTPGQVTPGHVTPRHVTPPVAPRQVTPPLALTASLTAFVPAAALDRAADRVPAAAQVRAAARVPAAAQVRVPAQVVRVAGIPDRMPSRPSMLPGPVPAQPSRRADERTAWPVIATAARAGSAAASRHGEPWSPVPVPVPIYVGLPPAPAPAARVVDLTHPGKWSDTLAAADDGLSQFADDSQLEEIIGRRRAAGDW